MRGGHSALLQFERLAARAASAPHSRRRAPQSIGAPLSPVTLALLFLPLRVQQIEPRRF